ncbi:hypothetical protein JD844_004039 [Phrynosoma platyrhinos]|uniref:Uncharacterized protein n=1 Tax=Phrynosoma platyrhinos TaxID=52577 RepID=A0ABQ7TMW3_PHRPL|nr:hypothetical protein JD844_004039 [Phrynosoma platyrhinos]
MNKMKQLEVTIEALQKEKVELFQRIRGAEECLRIIAQEKSYLKLLVADLQSDRDIANRNMVGLSKTIEKTVAAEAKGVTFSDKSTQLSDSQEMQDQANKEASQKVEQLTAELNLQLSEKEQLLADNKWRKENLQQVVTDNAYLKKVMAVFWDTVSSLKTENECLRRRLIMIIDKDIAKFERRRLLHCNHIQTHPAPEKKPLVERYLQDFVQLLPQGRNLADFVFLAPFVCLLQTRRLHCQVQVPDILLKQIRRETGEVHIVVIAVLEPDGVIILQDVSNLEQELLAIEGKVRELERGKKERKIYMDNCTIVFHVQDFEKGVRNDTKVLQDFLEVLRYKSKALTKARSEVVARHACICWEVQAVLLSCRETPEQQNQEQETPKDPGAEASGAHELEEEEEAKKLEHNLSTENLLLNPDPLNSQGKQGQRRQQVGEQGSSDKSPAQP